MRCFFLFVTLMSFSFGKAQLLDSIALFMQEPPRPVFRLDIRGSFVSNRNVRLMGAKLGLEHARRFQYGVGYSFLFTPVERVEETAVTLANLGASVNKKIYPNMGHTIIQDEIDQALKIVNSVLATS